VLDRARRAFPIERLVLAHCKGAMPEDFNMVADSVQVSVATWKEMRVSTSRYSVDQLAAIEDLRLSLASGAH
jgi:hypothetical protein